MVETIVLRSSADMTLANAERVAFDGALIEISEDAKQLMSRGRARFQRYLDTVGGYVYGSTTAPGARAKMLLSASDAARQSESIRNFCASQSGVGGTMLPARCVRLAVLSRLANAMTGRGKLRPATAEAVARLVSAPPPVPITASACSGEVIGLTWLNAPIADLPLAVGEAMALVNGSPFASAMVSDVALMLKRRLRIAEVLFALSIEAAQAPAAHFNPRLGDHWPDPYYRESLRRLGLLLADSQRQELNHQAPTCWRVLPNVLASALQALEECTAAAEIGLRALKDNPTFLFDDTAFEGPALQARDQAPDQVGDKARDGVRVVRDARADAVASSGGYHDHRSGKAIDQANSVMLDLGVLASKQIGRFLDGEGVDLPALLMRAGDVPGIEYVAWGLTEPLATARRASEPTSLDIGVHDPSGNQSDVTGLTFVAYGKHLEAARAWDDCLASLALITVMAWGFREAPLPRALRPFCGPLIELVSSGGPRIEATGEPLRKIREVLRCTAEEISTAEFAALFPLSLTDTRTSA